MIFGENYKNKERLEPATAGGGSRRFYPDDMGMEKRGTLHRSRHRRRSKLLPVYYIFPRLTVF